MERQSTPKTLNGFQLLCCVVIATVLVLLREGLGAASTQRARAGSMDGLARQSGFLLCYVRTELLVVGDKVGHVINYILYIQIHPSDLMSIWQLNPLCFYKVLSHFVSLILSILMVLCF